MSQVKRLKEALDIIESVNEEMTDAAEKCPHCGIRKYQNLEEWQTKQILSAASNRVGKAIDRLKVKGTGNGHN